MRTFKKLASVGIAFALVLVLSACGERRVQVYEPGVYKGAPITQPWDSPQYGGQQAAWERAIQARTLNQNDYWRITSSTGATAAVSN